LQAIAISCRNVSQRVFNHSIQDIDNLISFRMGYSTVLTLISLSVESYVTIAHIDKTGELNAGGVKRANVILTFIWMIAIVSALPTIANNKIRSLFFSAKTNKFVFLDSQSRSLVDSNHPIECLVPDSEICGYYYNEEDGEETLNYIFISTWIFFILPMILLGLLYIYIRIRIPRISATGRHNPELTRGNNTIWMLGLLYYLIFKILFN